jgi:hypothetical protein
MFRDALAKSLNTLDPLTHSISSTTESLLKNVPKSDYGYIPKVDVAFVEAMDAVMKKENIVDTNNLFSLFPAAAALLFLSEKWNKCKPYPYSFHHHHHHHHHCYYHYHYHYHSSSLHQ